MYQISHILSVAAVLVTGTLAAPFHFSNVFGSNMVLQRGKPIPIWGWGCTPSEVVTGSFPPYSNQSSTCDSTGYWKLTWPPQTVNTSPLTLTVCSPSGGCVSLQNVLMGDAVLCSGQSNTEFNVASSFNSSAEIAAAGDYPLIRVTSGPLQGQYDLHTIPLNYLSPELVAVDLPWSVANSSVIQGNGKGWDYYSAVCWFYLRDTFERNAAAGEVVPLGGVVQCYGGTSIQWWSSQEALDACPLSQTNPGSACCNYGGNSSCLYNTQIHPYTYGPTAWSAVFYYQGEQNAGCGGPPQIPYYRCALPALIADWRAKFNSPTLPFGVYLLAAWQATSTAFPLLRLAQVQTSIDVPNVVTCSTLDAGDPSGGPVHSPYKQLPASRCAAAMQTLVYARPSAPTYLGPRAVSASSSSSASSPTQTTVVTVAFTPESLSGGLLYNGSVACPKTIAPLACEGLALQLAAPNCTWVSPASSSVTGTGNGATLSLDLGMPGGVAAVRGLFGNWPLVGLYNGDGLPAEPWLLNVSGGCAPPSVEEVWVDTGVHA